MIPIKNKEEIKRMRESCKVAATVLDRLCQIVAPGISTLEIDQEAKRLMDELGATSACYNYKVGGRRFPAYTCLSVNEEIVHGIGRADRLMQPGDSITVDVCVRYNGFIGDNARTVTVGMVQEEVQNLIRSTETALFKGIASARKGNRVSDISGSVQDYVESCNFSVVREFVGHGVGRKMHEEPQIPNFRQTLDFPDKKLKPGMIIAIEPMVNMGRPEIDVAPDGWTAVTRDRMPAAHFEHTVLVTDSEAEILTLP